MCFPIVCLFLISVGGDLSVQIQPRVIGGGITRISKVPYTVQIRYWNIHLCGGTIISATWVVTAAHCVTNIKYIKRILILSGSTKRGCGNRQRVSKIIPHKLYNDSYDDYDIALMKVSTHFEFGNSSIAAAALPADGSTPAVGIRALASGWGVFWEPAGTHVSAFYLRAVEIPIVSRQKCAKLYQGNPDGNITKRMLCAGYLEGGKDACQGDSGGPLTIKGVLVGVVSTGEGCGVPNYPGIYADVGYFRNWIRKKTGI